MVYVIRHNDGVTAAEELVPWLRAQLDEDERVARAATGPVGDEWVVRGGYVEVVGDAKGHNVFDWTVCFDEGSPSEGEREHIARHDPTWARRDVEAKREMLAEHAPQLRTVEWDHDQNGKGEALCCPRCQNAEHSEWNPPRGQARGLPDGFVTPYVLAPCRTLRLLALAYAGEPGYREEWRP